MFYGAYYTPFRDIEQVGITPFRDIENRKITPFREIERVDGIREPVDFLIKTTRRVDAFPTLMFVRVRGRASALSLGGNPAKFIKRRELEKICAAAPEGAMVNEQSSF